MSRQFLVKKRLFEFTKIGRQWGRIKVALPGRNSYEIDIACVNEATGEMWFFECKWKSMSYRQALKVIDELRVKAEYVDGEKAHLGVIAKRIEDKDRLRREEGVFAFDVRDFCDVE